MGIIEGHYGCALYTTTIRTDRWTLYTEAIEASLYRGITILGMYALCFDICLHKCIVFVPIIHTFANGLTHDMKTAWLGMKEGLKNNFMNMKIHYWDLLSR
jgi:hypothetical protein